MFSSDSRCDKVNFTEFAVWQGLRPEITPESLRLLGLSPFEMPDLGLARAFCKQKAAFAIDLGRDAAQWPATFAFIERVASAYCGVRIPDHLAFKPTDLPKNTGFVVLSAERALKDWFKKFPIVVQVVSLQEAKQALAQGAAGLIAKGQESAGVVGEESSYILLQRVLALVEALPPEQRVPVWAQGGVGLHTAAGAIAGGAFGVVLDSQLALLAESQLSEEIKAGLMAMDGSETRLLGGYSVYARPGQAAAELPELDAASVREHLAARQQPRLLSLGQDAALAKPLAAQCGNVENLLNTLRVNIAGHLRQAVALNLLAEHSPLAQAHGTRYPVAQGPMTRVSDTAAFAAAVAENGALPFLALSLMQEAQARKLLEETRGAMVVGVGAEPTQKSWGVGVLGFAPPEILNPHLALIQEFRPSMVLLAGGRPSQARALQEQGIPAYLHAPSPGLLSLFLKDDARHFVFEGRECGGHVGPRFSFVLWEQQIQILQAFEHPEQLHLLFAGGIHDARSAAMVAALAAPLAANGAKIGVLMGSAYITTHEAVSCNAVNETFQKKVIAGEETVLLETAPGHATRCLPSGYVEQFNAEKQRLRAAGLDQQGIWKQLEDLNVGRLRVASKGVQREGDKLVKLSAKAQQAEGMYMIGQVAALQGAAQSMAELHEAVSTQAMQLLAACQPPALPRASDAEAIAIVGMECIYPGSPDLESYWANILAGRDLVTEVPAERWNADLYYDGGVSSKDKSISKWGGFIDDVPFDPLRYGIPPQSLAAIEPVQLLSLEVARRALLNAGYGEQLRSFDREKTAVIFGAESGMDLSNGYSFRNNYAHFLGEMPPELDAVLPELTEDSFPGILVNVISGRIANRLGLGGVNYAVDSACASSLTAIELAVKELRAGSSDMVLAGGADFHNSINDFLMFSSVKALSASGRCRSFDNTADGIALGEGAAVLVLKRLSDAELDGDRIYAVINGVAGSSDGKGLGLTAPRKEGQKRALERAYWQAGVLPGAVGLVEAHGTGTVVGDRTEMQTLTEIFNAGGALPLQAGLGSVKSQIGHTKCAAGIAGLIKVAKALHHQVLPPTIHIDKPNAWYDPAHSPFMLNRRPMPWPAAAKTANAYAAVSAFGFGGANFHAVLSAYRPESQAAAVTKSVLSGVTQWCTELFVFRAATFADVLGQMQQLADFVRASDASLNLRDLAFTAADLGCGVVQCALLAKDTDDLLVKLELALSKTGGEGVYFREEANLLAAGGKLAFVFPGQGSQSPGMLQDIFVTFPALQTILSAGAKWLPQLYPPTAYTSAQQQAQQQAITDTRVAQPTLGMANYAMASVLQSLGIQPEMLAGHSYGELVALATAGCFDLAELLRLSELRGISILEAAGDDPGRMAAVSASADVLAEVFNADSGVALANQNSQTQTVISGSGPAIEQALVTLKQRGIASRAIEVACAFHSPVVAKAEKAFAGILKPIKFHSPKVAVYSNASADVFGQEVNGIKRQMAEQIVSPVRFVAQIEKMYADGARVFVEVGPGRVLNGLIQKILGNRPHQMISTDQKGQPGLPNLLQALAQLAVLVEGFDPATLWQGRALERLDLTQARKLPATCWMVNGGRAYPRHGDLPAHAAKVLLQPLQLSLSAAGGGSSAALLAQTTTDQALVQYLGNMRQMAEAQRDIMLGMLGQPLTVQRPVAQLSMQTTAQAVRAAAPLQSKLSTQNSAMTQGAAPIAPVAPRQSYFEVLVAIVSERTGYPAEMLDADLDLEADLSIDSIKRVEILGEFSERIGIRDQLGNQADALLEQLAAHKTLHAITAWLHEKLPENPALTASADAPVDATSPRNFSVALDARQALLAIVSMRTGYPEEVLDLDLDLEADLSIDSIKRLEIVGELADQLGLKHSLADKDSALESLAALKNLRAIIEWLNANAGVSEAPALAAVSSLTAADDEDEDTATTATMSPSIALARYVVRSEIAPAAVKGQQALANKQLLITDDGRGVALELARRLENYGATVRVIDFSEQAPWPTQLENVDGLIHLQGLSPHAVLGDVKRLFNLIRDTLLHKASYLLVANGMGGNFGYYHGAVKPEQSRLAAGAGVAGMLKTVVKEWPEVRVHCVDLDVNEAVAELAGLLEIELLAENPLTEVAYREGQRYQARVIESALPLTREIEQFALNKDSVILLTGGARGITAQLAITLARRYACRLELIGRSPLPEFAEDTETAAAVDLKALRQLLIRNNPDVRPIEIEQRCSRILAAREIRETFKLIEEAGGKVSYTALDVRDMNDFSQYIQDLYHRHGRIDGVIHGAGIVEDKLLRHKTAESFQRVFDTKVHGALVLNKLIRDDVQFVVFFSSVAGAFGNKGQVDYATANDVLDKLAHSMQARIQGRVLSVNWGPWAGTGMVSPELEREYARKGIGLIPLKEGLDALLQELQFGDRADAQIVLMCASPESMDMAY